MLQIPDAPWIKETEQKGYCEGGWWNTPPEDDYSIEWEHPDKECDDDE